MHRLLYISTARTPPDQAMLDTILQASRRYNEAAGITGLLIAGGQRFLQVIEGSEDAVAQTFARIRRDPAHFDLVELAREEIAARSFPEWSMGYIAGGAAGPGPDLPAEIATLIKPIEDRTLRTYFTGFAKLQAG